MVATGTHDLELQVEEAREPEDVRIQQHFAALGGAMGTNEFTLACIHDGIWTDAELHRFTIAGAQSKVRQALKREDAFGLPFAGQTVERTEAGAAVWKQRSFWDYATYELNITDLVSQRDRLSAQAHKLRDECLARFGTAPLVDSLDGRLS